MTAQDNLAPAGAVRRRHRWRIWLLAALMLAAGATAYLLSVRNGAPPASGLPIVFHSQPRPLPSLAMRAEDGQQLDLKTLRGKVVLLNLWATWCPPCIREMPSLDRLQGVLGGPNFEVVALSIDTTPDALQQVRAFYGRTAIKHLRIYLDAERAAVSKLGAAGVPTTLLLDREGREIGRMTGTAEWDDPAIVAGLRRVVEQKP